MTAAAFPGFPADTLKFLRELAANNNREWFADNKARYEQSVREPALDFIQAMGQPLADLAPRFLAVPKKTGGSLMRVYRDTRFSKDKTPYKTNIGIQFRHEFAGDVHAPGFYVHVQPDMVFVGVGTWRPPSDALRAIRNTIAEKSDAWLAARDDRTFQRHFVLSGESLVRIPRGFERDHPMADDLRRKDYIGVRDLDPDLVTSADFQKEIIASFGAAIPLMRFLCRATGALWD